MRQVKNIVTNAIRLGTGKELARKAIEKCIGQTPDKSELETWCKSNASTLDSWINPEDKELWLEAERFAAETTQQGQEKLRDLGVTLGGGGHYGLLYFLTRTLKPAVVVETGVAAGFSSLAVLTALQENGDGRLLSSDFPYCRLDEPEKYIGILVPEGLKERWTLHIQGDRENIPKILQDLGNTKIGLFHYDSDKSATGRAFAYEQIAPHLAVNAICVFDDIQNNWHFRDLVESQNLDWRVFEFGGKYLGLIDRGKK